MAPEDHPEHPHSSEQVKRYAQDIAELYKLEREKRANLETAYSQLHEYAIALNDTVKQAKEANTELKNSYLDTIRRLVMVAEFKDEDTGDHISRMSRYCALIAEKLGLPSEECSIIFSAAPMHDVGKVSIPDAIMMKPGKLTKVEFEVIKAHTTVGARILSNSKAILIQCAEQIALSHHEKWNGKGYPHGLAGEDIPLTGRIVGLADVFDALTSRRPYKDPYPVEVAREIITKERGEHFDPDVTDVFLDHFDDMLQIKKEVEAPDPSQVDFRWSDRDIIPPK